MSPAPAPQDTQTLSTTELFDVQTLQFWDTGHCCEVCSATEFSAECSPAQALWRIKPERCYQGARRVLLTGDK